jgi:hypothetical protein
LYGAAEGDQDLELELEEPTTAAAVVVCETVGAAEVEALVHD